MLVAATCGRKGNQHRLSHHRCGVWVPAFAGTTAGVVAAASPKNKKPALPPAFVRSALTLFTHDLRANASRLSRAKTGIHFSGSCARSVRRFQRRLLLPGNRALDACLHLLERAHPTSPHASP